MRYDRVALSRVFTGRTTGSWMFTSYLIGRWRRERCNAGKWSSTFVRVSKWCGYSSTLHESKHEISYLCALKWRRNKWKTKKKRKKLEEHEESRSEDFFSHARTRFLTVLLRFFALSEENNDLSNKFPHVTRPVTFPLCFLLWSFFLFSFFLLKNILVPLHGIRASGNTGSAPSWPIRACLRIQPT